MSIANALAVTLLLAPVTQAEVEKIPHAEVQYEGIGNAQASALAEVIAAARQVCMSDFGFDMPETVVLRVECGPDEPTRLYTDGQDRLFLSMPSKDKLAKPSSSGVFNLYGMCHELGHMAMYRVLKERDWMSSAAAEGWAHYVGSVVVDRVYVAKGEKLWPDPYDYREDGTARLRKQLASEKPSAVAQAAGLWQKLESIIGARQFAKLFAAWQEARIDPTAPEAGIMAALAKIKSDQKSALEEWWKTAAPLFVEKRAVSRTKAVVVPAGSLTGEPVLLKFDDGREDGKKSIAGGGHARRFASPGGGDWYLRAVHVYGARYGHPKAPNENMTIALCDKDMATIATWKKPYGTFERGDMGWVEIQVPPTRVPGEFCVCLDFKPTATKGVFVGFDTSTRGNSQVATPGKKGDAFEQGDWMIRIELDQPKDADPLRAPQ